MKVYGKLEYDEGCWVVTAEPHVILRAKRIFKQISRQYRGQLVLSDTIDVCRDLDWMLSRYPLELSRATRRRLNRGVRQHRERELLVADLMSGTMQARPFELAVPPRDYQKIAAELALRTSGLLLADDVGLGKTCSAICMLAEPTTRPALVVTLTHLTRQWQGELQTFAPSLSTHVLRRGTPYDLAAPAAAAGQLALPGAFPDVIITSYSKLAGWAETLAPLINGLVFDEVQELRTGTASNKGAAAFALADAVDFRLGLSATPIYNYGAEIYNVMQPLAPGALGTRSEFMTEWCGEVDSRGRSKLRDPKAFGTYLRETGRMLRRTRADVGRELPEVVRIPHTVDTDAKPLREVKGAAVSLARLIVGHGEAARGEKWRAAEELSALLRHATGVAKAPYVAEFVRMLIDSGESVVLYGWHRDVYAIWQERLASLEPAMYTGTETPAQKQRSKQRFLSKETPLLIMSLRSGAGLDGLQGHCRTTVFGELDWSPYVHEQCIGRVHRDGQDESVTAYYLIADSGSDPVVADTLQIKRSQGEGLRNPNMDVLEKLDRSGERIRRLAEQYLQGNKPHEGASLFSFTQERTSRS